MNPLVRDLYKRLITAGKSHPQGVSYIREKSKEWIMQNKSITDERELRKAVARGRFWVREINALCYLHKYRTMKNRYESI